MISGRVLLLPGLVLGALLLSACGSSDQELQSWMTDQRNQSRSKIERLP